MAGAGTRHYTTTIIIVFVDGLRTLAGTVVVLAATTRRAIRRGFRGQQDPLIFLISRAFHTQSVFLYAKIFQDFISLRKFAVIDLEDE